MENTFTKILCNRNFLHFPREKKEKRNFTSRHPHRNKGKGRINKEICQLNAILCFHYFLAIGGIVAEEK